MLQFKNAETAAKYETDYITDPVVHLPGGKNKNGWKGRLSEIPAEQADRWLNRPNQNLLKLKEIKKEPVKKELKKEDIKATDS